MKKTAPAITFRAGIAVRDGFLCLSGAMDNLEDYARYSRVVFYNDHDPEPWSFWEDNYIVSSLCYIEHPIEKWRVLASLSEEGDVVIMEEEAIEEKIPGAGVYSEDAEGWGYLSDLQQIGEHLYAAGYAGQVYKRLGPNQWAHVDDGILQARGMRGGQYSIQVINGPHENAIYVAGCRNEPYYPVRASYWNGEVWRDLQLPEIAERITNIYVESESCIWLCGANGTLMLGNADDGFRSLSTIEDNQLFLSLCKFRDKIYLGSNLGLFVYDPANHASGIRKIVTGLTPELQDANIVDSVDQVLWSIGPKDIARFDGAKWERIHHPDNPPIGGATPAGKP